VVFAAQLNVRKNHILRTWTIFIGVSITLLYCTQIYSLFEYKRSAKGGLEQFTSEIESTTDKFKDNTVVRKMTKNELKETFTDVIETMVFKTTAYSILGLFGGLMLFIRNDRSIYVSGVFLSPLFVFKSIEYLENYQTAWQTIYIVLKNKPFLAIRNDILPMILAAIVFSTIAMDIIRNCGKESEDRV
jgi:Na+-translocating ferredoxin:NAD+ oxidoreductase RnfD subunit